MNAIFPICIARSLDNQPLEQKWLVDEIWQQQAVGIIGGEPKCCKSFLALSLAISVASGRAFLGQFTVPKRGKVIYYPAEDSLPIVKQRLEGICTAESVQLEKLPLFIITAPIIKLDSDSDQTLLQNTIKKIQPSLVILDPFIRMHNIDENASSEVAKILSRLRHIQRKFNTAIALVHHSKKSASKHRPGQALRGSSEFHAWGDCNLYLKKNRLEQISLTIEHRAHSSIPEVPLSLNTQPAPHLQMIQDNHTQDSPTTTLPIETRIINALKSEQRPLKISELRLILKVRNETISNSIQAMISSNIIQKTPEGLILSTVII